jgi:SAM-dependent methyltransferase
MPVLSAYARQKKIAYFMQDIPKSARILEVGCAEGWLGQYLKTHGWLNYVGLDLRPGAADVVGDIRDWQKLAIPARSFDVILAFEVVEHIHCFQEFFDLLKPGGLLMLTSPVPHWDWVCQCLEKLGLNQPRTSPHDHLIDFKEVPLFEPVEIKIVGLLAQWGKFRKPLITQ